MLQNKIVLLPFPFDDLSATKVRPAVCLTEPVGPHQHLVVAFVTSRIPDDLLETDMIITADQKDFPATGLKVSSTLRLHRLVTVTAAIIQRELGHLSSIHVVDVKQKLSVFFKITPGI